MPTDHEQRYHTHRTDLSIGGPAVVFNCFGRSSLILCSDTVDALRLVNHLHRSFPGRAAGVLHLPTMVASVVISEPLQSLDPEPAPEPDPSPGPMMPPLTLTDTPLNNPYSS